MGNCKSGISSAVTPNREATVLLLGIDNAGKTTLIANLNGDSTEGTTPTIGFSSTHLQIKQFQATFYDLGGGNRLRNIWKNYYSEAHGSIFVVDAGAMNRVIEAKEALAQILQHEKMKGKPLLVVANKQDSKDAITEEELSEQLDLDELLQEHKSLSRVINCIALKSASRNKSDPAIKKGVLWLFGQIGEQYDEICERVNADVAVQKAIEAQQRRERAERVRKIKEERERQRKLAGVTDEEDGEEEEPMRNPFKPVAQAALETEAREKAAKLQEKEIKERLKALQQQQGKQQEEQEEEEEEEKEQQENRAEAGEAQTETTVDAVDGGAARSQSTSGLSSSTDSLTDVTPESQASANSLHSAHEAVSTSADSDHTRSSIPPSSSAATTTQVGPIPDKKKLRKRHSTLLSRLKNRNRTAPLEAVTGVLSQSEPKLPTASSITWTGDTAELRKDVSFPLTTAAAATAAAGSDTQSTVLTQLDKSPLASTLQCSSDSNMQGLPQPPHRVRVTLPPIKVSRQATVDLTLHMADDIAAIPKDSIMKLSDPPALTSVEPLSSC